MSDSTDPPAPPPDDQPPPSPFPESSLTSPDPPPYQPPTPTEDAPEAPPPGSSDPAGGGSLWTSPQPPAAPVAPEAPGWGSQPSLSGGDPLAGAPPVAPGYTSPPPPGAGGPAYAPPPTGLEQPGAGTMVLAGWWRRVGAALIDGLIILAVALAVMAPLGIGFFSLDSDDGAGFFALIAGLLVAGLVVALVALAYAPVLMGMTNGKTVGRMVTGIRVVRANGQPMTIGFAALREVAVKALLVQTVAGSFTFGLAGLLDVLWPLWDDENRALHDFVVDTRTVLD